MLKSMLAIHMHPCSFPSFRERLVNIRTRYAAVCHLVDSPLHHNTMSARSVFGARFLFPLLSSLRSNRYCVQNNISLL
jgi:hypothetical protein